MCKKRWETPNLVRLVRHKPEESILTFCKSWWYPSGVPRIDTQCYYYTGPSSCDPTEVGSHS
jgi:hypothetical protein